MTAKTPDATETAYSHAYGGAVDLYDQYGMAAVTVCRYKCRAGKSLSTIDNSHAYSLRLRGTRLPLTPAAQ